jgi:hypothetical protein
MKHIKNRKNNARKHIAAWGGISQFSGKAADMVSTYRNTAKQSIDF